MAQAVAAFHLHTAPLTFPTLEAELLGRGRFTAGHVQQMFVYESFSLFELRQVALRNLERINASLAEDRRRDLFGGWDAEDSE